MKEDNKVRIPPPPLTPESEVKDLLHGHTVVDAFRWLEDGESEQTQKWTQAHNKRTETVFEQIGKYPEYTEQLQKLLDTEKISSPELHGNRLFYLKRRRGDDQPVLCVSDPQGCNSRVIVNPNTADEQGLVAMDWWYPCPDGSKLAYGLSEHGNEWSTLYVLDVDSGNHLDEEIERTRGASIAWQKDSSAFYYTRYPKPGEVPQGEENYHRQVYHHELGDDPDEDPLIFGEGRDKREMYRVQLSPDGRYLLLLVNHGWRRSDVFVRDEKQEGDFIPVVQGKDALFNGEIVENTLYLLTNWDAPHYRVLTVDLSAPKWSFCEAVEENENLVLQQLAVVGDKLVVTALQNATYRLLIIDPGTGDQKQVPLPAKGTISGLHSQPEKPKSYFTFQSFLHSPTIYQLDVTENNLKQILRSDQPVDPEDFTVRQVFFSSKDGTRVPMFLVHKSDLDLETAQPTVLTGYGGFNISRTPSFSPAQIPWLTEGGIYALANLRGGSEYGEKWHRSGMLQNKQNVFDDFTSAAEYLIEEGYTEPAKLGITGRSNGGLLVGAALTQRPDLFGAVACGVPLLDMLRYHKFLIAALWTHEYGSPDDPEAFEWLYDYSPYHNVKKGVEYPAVFLFTAESDTRVHPMHARKMAALLQKCKSSSDPVLLRVETKAGHGAGKPMSKVVEDQAQMWAFFDWQLHNRID